MASIPKTSCIWMLRNSWWCSHWVIGAAAIREVDVVGLGDVFRLVVVRARQPCICKLDTKRGRGWGANYCLRGKEWEVLYRMTFVEICPAMVSHALIHVQTIVHPLQCCLLPEFRLFLTLCLLWRTMRSTFSQQSFQSEPSTGNKWASMQLCALHCASKINRKLCQQCWNQSQSACWWRKGPSMLHLMVEKNYASLWL